MIAIVQPHRFTRLHDLFDDFCACFNDADTVIVAPVYAAGEAPIEGIDRDALVADPRRAAIATRRYIEGPAAIWPAWSRSGQARRLRRLPWRRQHHPMGLCACPRNSAGAA